MELESVHHGKKSDLCRTLSSVLDREDEAKLLLEGRTEFPSL